MSLKAYQLTDEKLRPAVNQLIEFFEHKEIYENGDEKGVGQGQTTYEMLMTSSIEGFVREIVKLAKSN